MAALVGLDCLTPLLRRLSIKLIQHFSWATAHRKGFVYTADVTVLNYQSTQAYGSRKNIFEHVLKIHKKEDSLQEQGSRGSYE